MTNETLRSIINSFAFLSLALFMPVFSAQAKTLTLQDEKWEVPAAFSTWTDAETPRNDFDLKDVAANALAGSQIQTQQKLLDDETINQIETIRQTIDLASHNPKLTIENGKVKEFDPGQDGQALDIHQLLVLLDSDLSTISLPIVYSKPSISLASTNTLGINELVSVGESNFTGSPNNRIHNINVGASKFDDLLIAQGEEFSFNKYLGEVDGEHGFLPELVIKPEGVTPEFGGGLCQVSSTAFRAAMNAGFPITARRNHSFAVQYYAPQGTDATIYPGSADLKFINDSPGPILIHTKIVGKKLYFEYYGTKDNREVAFEGPVQYDKKPDGSMKATWTRHVTQNGETKTQVFKSTYLPPALFHHEATTQASTPNPDATPTPAAPDNTNPTQTQ